MRARKMIADPIHWRHIDVAHEGVPTAHRWKPWASTPLETMGAIRAECEIAGLSRSEHWKRGYAVHRRGNAERVAEANTPSARQLRNHRKAREHAKRGHSRRHAGQEQQDRFFAGVKEAPAEGSGRRVRILFPSLTGSGREER